MNSIKGVVLEVMKNEVLVLTDGGGFVRCSIEGQQVTVGEHIVLEERKSENAFLDTPMDLNDLNVLKMKKILASEKRKLYQMRNAIAGIAAVFAVAVSGSWFFPYERLYMEVNPAIEVSYNIYQRVVAVKGDNADGNDVAPEIHVYGKSVDQAVVESLSVMREKGYLKEKGGVLIGTNNVAQGEAIQKKILTSQIAKEAHVQVAAIELSGQTVKEAQTLKTTPIVLQIVKKQMSTATKAAYEKNPETIKETLKVIEQKPVKEIIQEAAPVLDVKPKTTTPEGSLVPAQPPTQGGLTNEPVNGVVGGPVAESPTVNPFGNANQGMDVSEMPTRQEVVTALNEVKALNQAQKQDQAPKQEQAPKQDQTPKQNQKLNQTQQKKTTQNSNGTPAENGMPPSDGNDKPTTKTPVGTNASETTTAPVEVKVPASEISADEIAAAAQDFPEDATITADNPKKQIPPDLQKKIDQIKAEYLMIAELPLNFEKLPKGEKASILKQKIKRATVMKDRIDAMKIPDNMKKTLRKPFDQLIKTYENWLTQILR